MKVAIFMSDCVEHVALRGRYVGGMVCSVLRIAKVVRSACWLCYSVLA
jgi:hypothetical protein